MIIRSIGRLGVAAFLAVGLMVSTALPASGVVHGFDIMASSTIAIGTMSPVHLAGPHPTTNICAVNSSTDTLALDLNSTGGGSVSGATSWQDFPLLGSYLEFRMVILAGTVTITGTVITINISFQLEFANCGSSPVLCRTTTLNLVSSGLNPSSSVHPATSTATTLSGTSTSIGTQIGCMTILRAAINGFSATFSLDVHITT